jgi:hypothetical protein
VNLETATAGNDLLAYALDPARRPSSDQQYRELLNRFRTDPAFTQTVTGLATALGLSILAADDLHGLILDAAQASPFAPTLDYLRESLGIAASTDDRIIYGLIIAGIAAWCYPTAASLAEPGLRQVRARDVEQKLRAICECMAADSNGRSDNAEELKHAWDAYRTRKPVNPGKGGGLRHDCTMFMVGRALRWLADQRFLLKDPVDPELFRATDRFRHHVNAAASHAAYRVIAEALVAEDDQRPNDTPDGADRSQDGEEHR